MTIKQTMILVAFCGLSIAVAMPWPSRCGEGMRESACRNNLKQIGLAILEYEAEMGAFPAGSVANPDLPADRRLGWNYLLAPRLEIRVPFEEGNLKRAADDPSLLPLRDHPPGIVHCPTPWRQKSPSYVGIAGLGVDAPGLPKSHPRAGVFGDDRSTSQADILDGAANTMIVAESTARNGSWLAGGRSTVRGLDPARQPYVGAEAQFGSLHDRGTNVLMADGSVRSVRDSIDPRVFEAMSTIAGGEKISAP